MIIRMELGPDSYDIVVERGALAKASGYMDLDRKVLIVTDDGVPREYAEAIAAQCADAHIHVLPQGEANKDMEHLEGILKAMLDASLTRKDCVVAVGGGVVGDMTGFAAACYMRGIDFYNVPTTLLSQVDSSIGGKTAVDFQGVKNIVGAFHQPKAVVIDPDTLGTLDERQLMAGLAEAIKMAATSDEGLFELIEKSEDLKEDLEDIICRALLIKKYVVEQDPREAGIRKILNFGHTIGHAIEAFYKGEFLHGECVAMGMIPMSSREAGSRIRAVLGKYSLPAECPADADDLMPYVLHDKKMQKKTISIIFVPEIGDCKIVEADPEIIRKYIEGR